MRFFPALRSSLTSTQFYWQVPALPFKSSVFFWAKFYALLLFGILFAIIASVFIAKNMVEKYYPNDLVFNYENGTLQSNEPLPMHMNLSGYIIALKDKDLELTDSYGETYSSSYKDSLGDIPPFTLNKDAVAKFAPTVLPMFAAFFAVSSIMMIMLIRIPLLLLYTLVIRSVFAVFGKKFHFIPLVQMGLHASVVAEILNVLYFVLYRSRTFPMYDVAFFGIMILVLRSRRVQIVQIG